MIKIIGVGFVGSEVVYYLVNKGYKVKLYEMRFKKNIFVYVIKNFVEFVCLNLFWLNDLLNVVGFLKVEMIYFNLFILEVVNIYKVFVGSSFVVDRNLFFEYVIEKIKSYENIEVIYEEVILLDLNEYIIIVVGFLVFDLFLK